MSVTLNPTFSATGIAILKDSLEYPSQDGETSDGINGVIRFARFSWRRDLTVEFRGKTVLQSFPTFTMMKLVALLTYSNPIFLKAE